MIASEDQKFSKAVVLHSKRNGQEEQHLKTMREISRESVCGGETREKRMGLGCKEIISKDQLT
jgi:hypothetical protein